MGISHERYVNQIVEAVEVGDLTAAEGINEATASGDYLVIGQAAPSEYHYPVPAQTAVVDKGYWRYRILDETGAGAPPVVRAGNVVSTAIHAAIGGDLNVPNERMMPGRLALTSPEHYYQFGTIGWKYDTASGGYIHNIHQDLITNTEELPDETVIGAAGLVRNIGFGLRVPDEPGHYASLNGHENRGSLKIRMRDARAHLASAAIVSMTYAPLRVQR